MHESKFVFWNNAFGPSQIENLFSNYKGIGEGNTKSEYVDRSVIFDWKMEFP